MSRAFSHSSTGSFMFRGRKRLVKRKLTRNERWQLVRLVLWGILVLAITAYLAWSSAREEEKEEGNRPHAILKVKPSHQLVIVILPVYPRPEG